MWRRKRKSKMSRAEIAEIVASARPDLSPQEQARFVDMIVESMGMTIKRIKTTREI
jgi:hypothetical protein